jgi:hypothetical protein
MRPMSFNLHKYQVHKDLNIRSENLKLVQERVGNTLTHIGTNFLNRTQQLREWDYMKLKASAQQKKWSADLRQPTE